MKKKTVAGIALIVLLLGAAGAGAESVSADPALQTASGSGQIHLGLPFRTFAFSATQAADGSASGQAQIDNRSSGFRGHIAVDCMNVFGNVAVMSGVLTQSTLSSLPVGTDVFFAVQDNGEGPSAPPDEITLPIGGLGVACTFVTDSAQLAAFFVPIESGQIQVRS
jgi:hypothetical protein